MKYAFVLGLLLATQAFALRTYLERWVFGSADSTLNHQVQIPQVVQKYYWKNGFLPHPYLLDNEKLYQKLDKQNWIFQTEFDLEPSMLR